MRKTISKFIYFYIAATLFITALVVKYFLVDTDLGARFKDFNHKLLSSDIIFICALVLGIIGLIFYAIRKNKKSTLKDSTIIASAVLIMPITLVLALAPILETIYPGEVGDNSMASLLIGLTITGTFAAFAWVILLFLTLIKQTFKILTIKDEK